MTDKTDEAVAWIIRADNGNTRLWTGDGRSAMEKAAEWGQTAEPLYGPDVLSRAIKAEALLEEAVRALWEAEAVFALSEHPSRVDPQYGWEVETLGRRIGFGALISSASASWRSVLAEQGYPVGGEHTSGPCQATVDRALKLVRATLTAITGGK